MTGEQENRIGRCRRTGQDDAGGQENRRAGEQVDRRTERCRRTGGQEDRSDRRIGGSQMSRTGGQEGREREDRRVQEGARGSKRAREQEDRRIGRREAAGERTID